MPLSVAEGEKVVPSKIIRRETRKRGFFGWIFLIVFWLFNALMGAWLVSYFGFLSKMEVSGSAESAGRAIGGTIGTGMLLGIWASGAIILGILVLLSRGSKTIVEEVVE